MTAQEVLSRLPESAAKVLADHALDAERVAAALDWPADHAVLLVGSFAESLQSSASDLDFLVLREDGPVGQWLADDRGLDSAAVQSAPIVDRILMLTGGIEFDVCVLTRTRLTELAGILDGSVTEEGAIRSLPVLADLEDKLLCRLYGGTVLQNDDQVREWRRFLRLDHLPMLLTVELIADALSLLEDAVTVARPPDDGGLGSSLGGLIAAREAAELVLRAAVTSVGELGWNLRYSPLYRDRLGVAGDAVPGPLSALEELLFPAWPTPNGSAPRPGSGVLPGASTQLDASQRDVLAGYVQLVSDSLASVVGSLADRPEMAPILDFLREYGKGRWALDLRAFGLAGESSG
jgi:hypothetical protein